MARRKRETTEEDVKTLIEFLGEYPGSCLCDVYRFIDDVTLKKLIADNIIDERDDGLTTVYYIMED